MKESSVYKLIYSILTDKKVSNRFCQTQIRDKKTMEVTATLADCILLIEIAYALAKKEEEEAVEVDVKEIEIPYPVLACVLNKLWNHYGTNRIDYVIEEIESALDGTSVMVAKYEEKPDGVFKMAARIKFD